MYNTMNYDYFLDMMEDKHDIEYDEAKNLWDKIVEAGLGKFVENKYYIFTELEQIEIDGYVIDELKPLTEWVELSADESESVEIFEGWRLRYDDVMDKLIERLDENVYGDGNTYADMIFNADEPRKKVYELLAEVTKCVFEQKLDEMKSAMDNFVEKLENGTFKW
jgi:enoyl reductase-like protein